MRVGVLFWLQVPALALETSIVLSVLDAQTASRRFHKLKIVTNNSPGWLAQSETLVHEIDESSPLHDMDEHQFAMAGGMFHVVVHALNGVLLTSMVVTTTYGGAAERPVLFGARLVPMTTFNAEEDSLTYDYAKISTYESTRNQLRRPTGVFD
jgi:hypothetical protein